MDASSAQNQEMGMLIGSKAQQERKARPQPEEALKCPRCDSSNTKFCYYNNYSLSQPRYFCKSCRRYWTKGGTLRNVPVGGGCRKNKRSSPPSSSSSATSSKRSQDDHRPFTGGGLPPLSYNSNGNDLSLAFARLQKQTDGQLGFDHHHHHFPILENPTNTHLGNPSISNSSSPAFLDTLRSGFLDTTQNSFQNLCYGFENGGGGVSSSGEMLMPYGGGETMKRENENKVLWGFPWQQLDNGDHHGSLVVGDLDSGKESWNGFNSSWHGLLNSPLM